MSLLPNADKLFSSLTRAEAAQRLQWVLVRARKSGPSEAGVLHAYPTLHAEGLFTLDSCQSSAAIER